MVKGLDIFLAHFRDYTDRYVLIGGAACDIAMAGAGLQFRATEDLDIRTGCPRWGYVGTLRREVSGFPLLRLAGKRHPFQFAELDLVR